MADTIRVGIVGAGANTRRRHVPGLRAQPGVEIVAVVNRTRASSERAAAELGIPKVHESWEALVDADEIDAVCIGAWPYLHAPVTLAALARGKHVLCEARMAMNLTEARAMLDASRRAPHLVAQLVPAPHTLPVDAALARLVAAGYLGQLLAVELQAAQGRFVDAAEPLHWRQDERLSGLNVLNMGIWYEALMRWVGPAARVMAMASIAVPERRDADGTMRRVTVPDHVEILATLAGGALAHLRFSAVTGLGPANEVWLFGTDGTVRLDVATLEVRGGRRGDAALAPLPVERGPGWRVEEEFVNAIRGRERVTRTSFEDGVRYMAFTEAVARSAAEGRAVDVAA
ncbi:MAG TPA: Gfo/Idh/MocA family oxidoreductase [Candidatus Tectomicrobia bacterium]|nr:Gfo/Idh/MocA family oxidoreductase [Candidatus Tectomicrobia bacterium]